MTSSRHSFRITSRWIIRSGGASRTMIDSNYYTLMSARMRREPHLFGFREQVNELSMATKFAVCMNYFERHPECFVAKITAKTMKVRCVTDVDELIDADFAVAALKKMETRIV